MSTVSRLAVAIAAAVVRCGQPASEPRLPDLPPARDVAEFEALLEELRDALKIPAPNPGFPSSFAVMGFDRDTFVSRMAKPYRLSGNANVPASYPGLFSTAAGLVSTAVDMARYSMAMDADLFLDPATKALAYAPTIGTGGDTLPYGLGWFSTRVSGIPVVWHYGYWTANSSLIIKVPSRDLAFVNHGQQ